MACKPDFEESKLNAALADIKKQLIERNYSESELIDYCALLIANEAIQDSHIEGLKGLIDDHEKFIATFQPQLDVWQKQNIEFVEAVVEYKKSVPMRVKIGIKNSESSRAKKAVQAKLENDPRQKAKDFVFNCWQVWREEPERYKFKSDFAKDMLKQEQCKSLTSQKVVEDWCREWEKAHPAG